MPADSTEKPSEGLVVLAGPGTTHPETGKLIPNPCKEGDLILLSEYVGEKVDYCGDKHSFVSASEVLGVFDGGSPVVGSFKPLQDRVLVKLQDSATETASGIALASESTDEPTQGEVIAVGAGLVTSQVPAHTTTSTHHRHHRHHHQPPPPTPPPPTPPPHHHTTPAAAPHHHHHHRTTAPPPPHPPPAGRPRAAGHRAGRFGHLRQVHGHDGLHRGRRVQGRPRFRLPGQVVRVGGERCAAAERRGAVGGRGHEGGLASTL